VELRQTQMITKDGFMPTLGVTDSLKTQGATLVTRPNGEAPSGELFGELHGDL